MRMHLKESLAISICWSEVYDEEIGRSSVSIPLYLALTELLLSDRFYFPAASFSSRLLLPIISHIPATILLERLRLPGYFKTQFFSFGSPSFSDNLIIAPPSPLPIIGHILVPLVFQSFLQMYHPKPQEVFWLHQIAEKKHSMAQRNLTYMIKEWSPSSIRWLWGKWWSRRVTLFASPVQNGPQVFNIWGDFWYFFWLLISQRIPFLKNFLVKKFFSSWRLPLTPSSFINSRALGPFFSAHYQPRGKEAISQPNISG